MPTDNDEISMGNQSHFDRGVSSANGLLARVFSSCDADPKGSVHRAWGISLIFIVLYFVMAIIESTSLLVALVWRVAWNGRTVLYRHWFDTDPFSID